LSMTRSTQSASIDALRNQIATREQYLLTLKSGEFDLQSPSGQTDSPTKAVLIARRADLEAKRSQLLKVFTTKHPEVREIEAQIESINNEIDKFDKEQAAKVVARAEQKRTNPQIASLEIQIASDRRELEQRQKALAETEAEYRKIQELINSIPMLQNEAQKINRDYDTTKSEYDGLVAQINKARQGADLYTEFGSYSFRVQDAANLPETPVAPKRMFLYPALAAGLAIALAVEARYLFTVRDARDVEHYMRLPLLVTVPQIVTEQEQRQRTTLRLVQFAGVVLLILVAIPVLVTVIQKSRVMNFFTGAY
jgi:flagellar biosynthesis chaperone FliJ